jgi:predicted Rossmann fold flavoprotein
MESMGVRLKLEETGKYFPETDDARTVLDALLAAVNGAGVSVMAGARVVRLERGFRLGVQRVKASAQLEGRGVARVGEGRWPLPAVEPDEWLEADRVIVATGGLSFPRTGSDGTGYALVTALGHTLEPPVPALTPLSADDALCAYAQGVTLDAELALWAEGRVAERVSGSLLIAHFGYSGPAALDLSRHWHRHERARERLVTACFTPGATLDSLRAEWVKAGTHTSRLTARRFLASRLPERLADRLCHEAGVEPAVAVSQVSRESRDALLRRVVERPMGVTGTLGYEKAEVTAGGVRLDEVDPSTLESRIVPGLFLCGEILDVEGRLGGFNFQWSWSSGTVAGRAAAT